MKKEEEKGKGEMRERMGGVGGGNMSKYIP